MHACQTKLPHKQPPTPTPPHPHRWRHPQLSGSFRPSQRGLPAVSAVTAGSAHTLLNRHRERERERERERQTDRQTDRQTERETGGQTETETAQGVRACVCIRCGVCVYVCACVRWCGVFVCVSTFEDQKLHKTTDPIPGLSGIVRTQKSRPPLPKTQNGQRFSS